MHLELVYVGLYSDMGKLLKYTRSLNLSINVSNDYQEV